MRVVVTLACFFMVVNSARGAIKDLEQRPQKLVCVSWFNLKTEITEKDISDYAMAEINWSQGDWSYHADVIEGKMNSIEVNYLPLEVSTHTHSSDFPLNTLQAALRVKDQPASVDCDIRLQ